MNKMLSVVLGASLVLAGCGNDRKVVIVDQVEHQREVVYVERNNDIGVGEVLATALLVDALTDDRDYDRYDDRRGDTTIVNNTTVVKNTTVDNKKSKTKKGKKTKATPVKKKTKVTVKTKNKSFNNKKKFKTSYAKVTKKKKSKPVKRKKTKTKKRK